MNCNGNVLNNNYCESFREGHEDYMVVRKELKCLLLIQEPLPDEPSKAGQRKHLLPEPGTS